MPATLLLEYALGTQPFPAMASPTGSPNLIEVTIVATNSSGNDVTLQGISITLPVGITGTDLTNDPGRIETVASRGWQHANPDSQPGRMKFVFLPAGGNAVLKNGESVNFVLQKVAVNGVSGETKIEIVEGSGGCSPDNCPTVDLTLTKFPNGWGEVNFIVDHSNINLGDSVGFTWDGPSGATYSIQYYDPHKDILVDIPLAGPSGHYPGASDPALLIDRNTVFTLDVIATIDGQHFECKHQQAVTIEQKDELGCLVYCSVNELGAGNAMALFWKTTMAKTCSLSVDGGKGEVSLAPSEEAQSSCTIISKDAKSFIVSGMDGSSLGSITLPDPLTSSIKLVLQVSDGSKWGQGEFTLTLVQPVITLFQYKRYIAGHRRNRFGYPIPIIRYTIFWKVVNSVSIKIDHCPDGLLLEGTIDMPEDDYSIHAFGFLAPVSEELEDQVWAKVT